MLTEYADAMMSLGHLGKEKEKKNLRNHSMFSSNRFLYQ